MVLFWEICQNGSLCIRQGIFIGIQLIILIFTLYSLISLIKTKGLKFQILPLTCNSVSMIVIILITIFAQDYEMYLAGWLIEIYIYFIFLYMFLILILKIDSNFESKRQKQKLKQPRFYNIIFGIVTMSIVVMVILVFCKTLSSDCDTYYRNFFYEFLGSQLGIYILTVYFGWKIFKMINQINELRIISSNPEIEAVEDEYIRLRKIQILMILITFTLSVSMRVIWIITFLNNPNSYECVNIQQIYILKSKRIIGQFIIIIAEGIPLIPNLLIPFSLYVISYSNFRKNPSINLNYRNSSNLQKTGNYLED